MKINFIKAISVLSTASIMAMPMLAHADNVAVTSDPVAPVAPNTFINPPAISGSDTGGVDTNSGSFGSVPGSAPVISGQSTGGADTAPVTAPTTAPTSGGSSGGSSYGGSGGGYSVVPISAVVTYPVSSCPLITGMLKIGVNNDQSQVSKLQTFLKDVEHMNVSVTGTFDTATEQAVKDFQAKYMNSVMGPWGATRTTGVVSITTMKKINELACGQPLTLNYEEMAMIHDYNQKLARGENASQGSATTVTGETNVVTPSETAVPATGNVDVGSSDDQSQNTAAAANPSILKRFWNFIVSLFR